MSDLLPRLARRGVLSPLDVQLAHAMSRLAPGAPEEVILAAALASRAVAHGHVCAHLPRIVSEPMLDPENAPVEVELPTLERWSSALAGSPLVGDGSTPTPMVLEERTGRLYLYRYWRYQTRLARSLSARAEVRFADDLDREVLRDGLRRLFPPGDGSEVDKQRVAALVAVERALALITGGPGTGKTTTVVRILALLQEQAEATGKPPLRVELLAPTGKAAARLAETIRRNKTTLDCTPAILEAIPETAATIHRRLGHQAHRPTRFRYDADNPLPTDAVLVDEASMVDLALMTKLVEAVPIEARLILLGDRDQLASVEAGAILGDICPAGVENDCVVNLSRSHRFDAASGISVLAAAIKAGRGREAVRLLRGEADGTDARDVALVIVGPEDDPASILARAIDEGFREYLAADGPEAMLAALDRFRILCAHRRGLWGAERVNALVERRLAERGLLQADEEWYHRRPILITRNDYDLNLFNGDIGVLVAEANRKRAFFPSEGGAPVALQPARLPPHETVFAMTVHKSQGSELDRVALLLPQQVSPILTRELVYTGVTRARKRVAIYGSEDVLVEAIGRRIERASGLRESLWTEGTAGG